MDSQQFNMNDALTTTNSGNLSSSISVEAEVIIRTVKLNKYFGDKHVLKDIDFEVHKKEVVAVIGPSGSGKSTLIRCLNALEKATSGEIYIHGHKLNPNLSVKQLSPIRSELGMVFQNFNLFPHMTVLENIIEAPQRVRHISKAVAQEKAKALLAQVGLSEKIDAYPRQLSGGQQQRVAIARAMAMEPHLMLFDEPTSALDPELVGDVLEVIRGLATAGMTMIVVTHEIGFAREIADSVVFMDEGLVVESGNPRDVLDNPRNPRTQAFLSKVLR